MNTKIVATRFTIVPAVLLCAMAIPAQATPTPTPTPVPTPSCSPPCILPVEWTENFDDVTPPALPPDWLATNALGPPPFWVTSNSGVPSPPADTLPNAAFIDDPAVVSDKRLDSRGFAFPGSATQLSFRHNFNLEASDTDPSLGFDGGVLEISTDGGNTFQDIIAAGGLFVVGGYNRTISTDRGSPIAGRQAWSGNSDGFITTVVDLSNVPIVVPGSRLRWRMASDNSGSGEGWRVDTVRVVSCLPVPCETPTPTPTPTPPSPTPTATPGPTTLSARGYKVQGQQRVDLSWNGATSNNIDVYRNGVLIATVPNIPGFYTDNIGARGKGSYSYKVCEAGTQNCSNEVTVRFGGPSP